MENQYIQGKKRIKKDSGIGDEANMLGTKVSKPKPYKGYHMKGASRWRRYLVHVLVMIYGIGACIGVNGIVAEVPLLVISAPEGLKLPAYLTVVASLSYVVPAVYAICVKCSPRFTIRKELPWISGVFLLGITAMGLLAFFHDQRTTINGVEYSTLLHSLFFAAALGTGARNVLLLPYLQNFEGSQLTSFYIGEGLSGLFPSVAALIQGVGGSPICSNNTTDSTHPRPPNFPARDYFLFIAAILVTSTFAFWGLEYLKDPTSRRNNDAECRYDRVSTEKSTSSGKLADHGLTEVIHQMKTINVEPLKPNNLVPSGERVTNRDRIYLYVMMGLICCVAHGYLNTVEAYSSRPYGSSAHNLVVNLSQLATTVSCAFGFWLPPLRIRGITRILVVAAVGSSYVSWLALSSPTPLWHDTTYGVAHLLIIWILLMGFIAYAKLAIVAIFYQEPGDDGLYVIGVVAIVGTICGAALSFVLFNYTTFFTPYTACEPCEHPG